MKIEQYYIDYYNKLRVDLGKGFPASTLSFRDLAIERFARYGFPGKKMENYQYTSTEPLFQEHLNIDIEHRPLQMVLEDEFHCDIYNIDSYDVFVANGWYREHKHQLPQGVILCGLQEAASHHADIFYKYFHQQVMHSEDGLVNLNTALALEGIFLYVPENIILDKPIQLINVFSSENNLLVNQRNLFVVEKNAQAKVLVRDHSLNNVHVVANLVNEVVANADAQFDLYALQYVHNNTSILNHTFVMQEASSKVLTNNITLHGGTVRNNTYVKLNGEYAENLTYGLGLPQGKQHVDSYCKIEHMSPNCKSFELFKNILDDDSTAAFCGHIHVYPNAQKTDARQSNQNICLSPQARINTKPQLEIYADDVKCSHGATVGQLDESALFFLRARGIPKKEAQLLLLSAFTHEAVEHVRIEGLKEQLHDLIEKRFRGELNKCYNCPQCHIFEN